MAFEEVCRLTAHWFLKPSFSTSLRDTIFEHFLRLEREATTIWLCMEDHSSTTLWSFDYPSTSRLLHSTLKRASSTSYLKTILRATGERKSLSAFSIFHLWEVVFYLWHPRFSLQSFLAIAFLKTYTNENKLLSRSLHLDIHNSTSRVGKNQRSSSEISGWGTQDQSSEIRDLLSQCTIMFTTSYRHSQLCI